MKTTIKLIFSQCIVALLLLCKPLQAESAPADAKNAKSPALDLARQLNNAFIEVADRVSPAVVVITVTQKAGARDEDEESYLDMLPPELRRYFEERGGRGGNDRREAPQKPQAVGRGSGIVMTEDGYILTNNHVVEDADKITVRFRDGKEFPAEVKGHDPQSDIAVVKISAKGLTYAKLGDSTAARVGEFVLAIGAPFDLDYSVTVGHISAKGRAFREFGSYADQDFIQTDASINPGNSGGPLVNLYGEVIGINTMIRGIGTGIGFAVPSSIAKNVTEHLIHDGKFVRSRIGVAIRDLREYQEYKEKLPNVEDGVIIQEVLPDSPARGSLKAGDVVTAVDGHLVKTSRELKEQIAYKKPGETVTLDTVRLESNGKPRTLKIKVKTEAMPSEEEAASNSKKRSARGGDSEETTANFGMTVKSLTKDLADEYGIDVKQGVLVTEVQRGSVAEEKGISPGDVITEINGSAVTNLRQFREALKTADSKKGIIINFTSKGTSRFTVLKEK